MARECSICAKKIVSGNAVSHSNIKTRRKLRPNLQSKKISVGGVKKSVLMCAKCIKTA